MAGPTLSLLSLPPEILFIISDHLPPNELLSLKATHPALDVALPESPRDMHSTPIPPLLDLPPELIYEITDHLPPDAILALKLTHRGLNGLLSLESRLRGTTSSDCSRLAIRNYLSKRDASHMRCIVCKKNYPLSLFSSASSPACKPLKANDDGSRPEVIELPRRFCGWHVGRLTKITHTGKGGRNEWVSTIREMCMHCGTVKGWGECNCKCDSCWIRSVRTYTRYLNNEVECKRFTFFRDLATKGECSAPEQKERQLCVEEVCWDSNATSEERINMPVNFEDIHLNDA